MDFSAITDVFEGFGSFTSSFILIAVVWLLYTLAKLLYRFYLSPIARFPGPRLAAVTFWYEIYYDVVKNGHYTFEIKDMHKKYGPIVRINPSEIHIETPDFYDKIYAAGGRKRDRWDRFVGQFGLPESVFGTVDHDKHRIRRSALNPLFSKAAVRRLQSVVDERLDKFLGRVADFQESEKPMIISTGFSAFTADIAMEYSFARSEHQVEMVNFDPEFNDACVAGASMGAVTKPFPWLVPLMQSMPDRMTKWFRMSSYVQVTRNVQSQVRQIQANSKDENWKDVGHPTIFHSIINSNLPESEKSYDRLWQDGQTVVFAGTLTTAWTLSNGLYYLLSQPSIFKKLRNELRIAMPDPSSHPSLQAIEQLPYLTACIQESLRLGYGACTRLQRIATDETIIFNDGTKDWAIPPGTPVSMTSALLHHDESIFPNSHAFIPERWLENPHLDKYLVSFSKGSRQCIGINLAYAEIYLMFARLFRAYGSQEARMEGDLGYLELYDTTVDDVRLFADHFIPLPRPGSKGVRVRVMR